MHKLSNDELAENIRAANRRRSERQRARRVSAGRAALTVWIPAELQQRIVNLATDEQATTSEIATGLLADGLAYRQRATSPVSETLLARVPTAPESLPLFEPAPTEKKGKHPISVEVPVDLSREAMMQIVAAMLKTDLSGNEIARRLNAAGYRATNGAELRGANVLREYRQWCEKGERLD